jgi:hypothetical protein
MAKRKLPDVEATNRFGLVFGRSRNPVSYHSGRMWRAYYRRVCLRCGWAFAGPRWKQHRLIDCDMVLVQWTDRAWRSFCRRNLYGR